MNDFPRSYLDKLREDIEKLSGGSSIAKMMSDVNRAVGSIGQRELEIARALSQETEMERMRKALGLDQMEAVRRALLQDETEQMQRMLGIHRSSIAEQAKRFLEGQRLKQLDDAARMQEALERATRPAWIDKLRVDLTSNSALMDAALKALQPVSAQVAETARSTNLWREQLSAIDQGIAGYLGPAALESVQRMLGPLTTAEMLAAFEGEPEGAEEETRAALESIGEAAHDAESVQQVVLVLVDAIQKTEQPFVQRALFQVLWPLIVMLMGVILAPVADHYIKKHLSESPQESAKAVQTRAANAVVDLSQLTEYRYVSSQRLQVRDNPRANSPAVATLQFGQAVRVVEKGKDFTLVAWSSPDGSAHIRGWVYSRYLKKFK
jgi:hypothetical protein